MQSFDSDISEEFRESCIELFERMYGCSVGRLNYDSIFGFDLIIHADTGDILVKCLSSDGEPIDYDSIRSVHERSFDHSLENIFITDGSFTDKVWGRYVREHTGVILIDGLRAARLFDHYGVDCPQRSGYSEKFNEVYQNECGSICDQSSLKVRNQGQPMSHRVLAAVASVIIPGGGCAVLYAYTKDKRYLPLGAAFLILSFILVQILYLGNVVFALLVAIYFISIIISFVTLDVPVDDDAEVNEREHAIGRSNIDMCNMSGNTKRRYWLTIAAVVLSAIVPGAGAAILFYISRERKHILYGNLFFWTSFIFMFNVVSFENWVVNCIILAVIQLVSFVYTNRNIDKDLIPALRPVKKGLYIAAVAYVSANLSRLLLY